MVVSEIEKYAHTHAFVSENILQMSFLSLSCVQFFTFFGNSWKVSFLACFFSCFFLLYFYDMRSLLSSRSNYYLCVVFSTKMHLFRLLLGFHAVRKLNLTNRRALVWRIARKSKLYEDVIQVYGAKPPCSTSINFLNFKGNMALNFATHAQQDFEHLVRRIER